MRVSGDHLSCDEYNMTDNTNNELSANKQALLRIRELKQQIAELKRQQSSTSEPIAIVSMACRFPRSSNTPEKFWQSLIDQTDEVSEIPEDRWDLAAFHSDNPEIPGRMYARNGVFLDRIDQMDPEFFGISPREATWVDPQQRLLMEVGWEALERAAWIPEKIGDRTGVFIGWMHNDYQNEASDSFLNLNPYIATGAAGSFLCGRLAYYLGLKGPSVAVDTACSSSLVALHLACLSLQQRDCDRAFVGGVNAICSPTTNILTCKLKALSPTGQSRAFDAAADGYLRGEGCGVITLRRLADAQRDGDTVIGVIKGSAIGHNGSGGGLTVPNPKAQEQVIREALSRAKLLPEEISYLEAHGTGTELGDPIELQAAASALAADRRGTGPLLVGSVKTNIGHLEAAAGMAGIIKVLLALQNDCIPGQLNFETPNPHIPWDRLDVKILTESVDWPGEQRNAGVSAFGMSGTNAHAVIAGNPGGYGRGSMRTGLNVAPPSTVNETMGSRPDQAERSSGTTAEVVPENAGASSLRSSIRPTATALRPQLIVLSGRTEEALRDLAGHYAGFVGRAEGTEPRHDDSTNAGARVARPGLRLPDMAFTTTTGRSHFEHRAAVVAKTTAEAVAGFQAIARAGKTHHVVEGTARRPPKVAWQFTGQGSQYAGMARGLYDTEPVFRDAIDHCDSLLIQRRQFDAEQRSSVIPTENVAATPSLQNLGRDQPGLLEPHQHTSLKHVLFDDADAINHTSWTQPAIFAVQMGLAKLLQHRGIKPDVVLGHSVGQYAAACVAGVMSWDDGLKLIAERGRLIGELPSGGLMMAVFASKQQVEEVLQERSSVVSTENSNSVHGGARRATITDINVEASIAAFNGTHIVVSGSADAVVQLEAEFTERTIRCKRLTTSHAFHSSLMDPALEPFQSFAQSVTFRTADIPLVCNVAGEVLSADQQLDAAYWANHIRQPVAFANSIDAVQEFGCDIILELGPQGHLTRMAAANWKGAADSLVSCLDRNADNQESLVNAIARLHVNGAKVDFASLHTGHKRRPVLLPTYPFQRRRFWGPDKPRTDHAEFHTAHPLLGQKISLAGVANETRFESFVETDSPPWLPDHEVMGQVVLPGAAYVEMAIGAADSFPAVVSDIAFEQPLSPRARTALQTVIRRTDDAVTIEAFSSGDNDNSWSRHFTARLGSAEVERLSTTPDLATLKTELTDTAAPADFYARMSDIGLNYGPAFQTITEIRFSESTVLTKLATNGDVRGFHVPPTLLDGALHSLAVGLLKEDDGNLFLPIGIDSVECLRPITEDVWCHAKWVQNEGSQRSADLTLFGESGEVLMAITGLQVKQISRAVLRQMSGAGARRLLYELQWNTFRLPAKTETNRRWLVVGDGDAADSIAASLSDEGHDVIQRRMVFRDRPENEDGTDGSGRPSHENDEDAELPERIDGVAWLLSDDGESNCRGLLSLVKQLSETHKNGLPCGLNLITRSGVAITAGESCEPEQSKYWGLGRVIGAEQPMLRCRLLDFAADADTPVVAEFLQTETRDNQLAIREGKFLATRLKSVNVASGRDKSQSKDGWQMDATTAKNRSYLITGGLGQLGRLAAEWLADKGAGQVVLVSRRQPDEATEGFLESIAAAGCDVVVHNADMGSRENVASLFSRFQSSSGDSAEQTLKPLGGIIHAAGVLDDALIGEQTWERFESVLSSKVTAAKLLDEFSRQMPLEFFVLYSSVAAVLGSRGQSNYATGNAFLDGLAWQRKATGLPATSINWGPWTEGMASDERIRKQMALQGITPLSAEEAHQSMEYMLASDVVQATVLDVDWRRMQMGLGPESPPMLEGLAPARQKSQMGDSAFVGKLKQLRGNAQKELLVTTIQELLQQILSTSDVPETDRALIEMGLDSLMAVEFSTQLQMMLGESFVIAPTMLFDHPTVDAISDHVLSMIGDDAEDDQALSPASVKPVNSETALRQREPIAIVGMSCRFPGAQDVDEFWNNLLKGVDSVCEIPNDRWDIDRFYSADREPGRMYTREGGFLEDIGDFDPAFFNISEQEACWIDPQHRLLLENSYRALEDAGIPTAPLADKNVGVFMGIMGQDYAFLPQLDDAHIVQAFEGAGLSHSAGVGRISYVFGFEGPSIAVDTASSSSLVAVHQAVRNLQDGNCNMALAGGVNAILAPVNSLLMSKAGLLSPDGRCKSFSAAADGFGRGEGCGVVVLKRLSDAERDGDNIMAVIRGGAVVHNGAGGGITAPSGKSQARVIAEALDDAKIVPSQVQYLEAHGTGTEFGDPMEIGAAAGVLGKGRKRDSPLLVGTVKANISHLEAAGGISGLIKTTLCLHHGIIPAQAHFEEPSPHVPWKRLPVKMVTETTSWPKSGERFAGVTALGLVGTNAHVVLSSVGEDLAESDASGNGHGSEKAESLPKENLPPVDTTLSENDSSRFAVSSEHSELLVLSARSEQALADLVARYCTFLNAAGQRSSMVPTENHDAFHGGDRCAELADICYTAATGRRHFEHRIALNVESSEDAAKKLQNVGRMVCQGHQKIDDEKDGPGRPSYGVATKSPKVAWIFGNDALPESTARQLFAAEPSFRQLVTEFDTRLQLDGSPLNLTAWLSGDSAKQAAFPKELVRSFVVQAGLVAVLRKCGVEPSVVFGTGVGQYVAACVAGCLCFKDGLALVLRREQLEEPVSAESLDEFEAFADQFNFYPPNMPLACSVSGAIVPVHKSLGGKYWRDHVSADAKITEGLSIVHKQGCDVCLEVWPIVASRDQEMAGQVLSLFESAADKADVSDDAVGDSAVAMKDTIGRLYTLGVNLNFSGMYQGRNVQRVRLPHYPFQKKRYWITEMDEYISE